MNTAIIELLFTFGSISSTFLENEAYVTFKIEKGSTVFSYSIHIRCTGIIY